MTAPGLGYVDLPPAWDGIRHAPGLLIGVRIGGSTDGHQADAAVLPCLACPWRSTPRLFTTLPIPALLDEHRRHLADVEPRALDRLRPR